MTAPNVGVKISGEDTGVEALLRSLSRQLKDLETVQNRTARSTTATGTAARGAARELSLLERAQRSTLGTATSVATKVAAAGAAYFGLSQALSAVSRGLNVNAELEQSALGIASLITAQSKLTDATGRTLDGTEALSAAQVLSADQLQKLRVAGLQTTATFEELARAFQTGVGPGLAAGLSLDGVRETVIGITQAATALGVPTRQLDQEVRSILDGTIDVNSRVAKTLGITNAQVKLERERGTLQAFLNEKLLAFNVAGAQSALTFRGVASNIREALDLFTAGATQPLFDKLKVAGQRALTGIFDIKTAQLSPAYEGIVALARQAFAGLGDLLESALDGAVDGAKRLSQFVVTNRVEIVAFAKEVGGTVSALASAVAEAAKLAFELGKAAVESGLVSGTLRTIESAAKFAATAVGALRDNALALAIVLTSAALYKGIALIGGLSALPTALGLAGLAIAANPITAIAVALTAVSVAYGAVQSAAEKARDVQREQTAESGRSAQQGAILTAQYRAIAQQLESGALKGDKARVAQEKLNTIKDALIKLSPNYQKALDDETGNLLKQADALDRVNEARRQELQAKIAAADVDVARARANLSAASAQAADPAAARFGIAAAQVAKYREELRLAAEQATDAREALTKALTPAPSTNPQGDPKVSPKGAPDPSGAADTARANAKAAANATVLAATPFNGPLSEAAFIAATICS